MKSEASPNTGTTLSEDRWVLSIDGVGYVVPEPVAEAFKALNDENEALMKIIKDSAQAEFTRANYTH